MGGIRKIWSTFKKPKTKMCQMRSLVTGIRTWLENVLTMERPWTMSLRCLIGFLCRLLGCFQIPNNLISSEYKRGSTCYPLHGTRHNLGNPTTEMRRMSWYNLVTEADHLKVYDAAILRGANAVTRKIKGPAA